MANPQNLNPLQKGSEKARICGRKGGKASGRARRLKADIKAAILEKLGDDASLEQLVEAMYKEALKGNVQAATFLRDTAGQKPVDKVQAESADTVKVYFVGEGGRKVGDIPAPDADAGAIESAPSATMGALPESQEGAA